MVFNINNRRRVRARGVTLLVIGVGVMIVAALTDNSAQIRTVGIFLAVMGAILAPLASVLLRRDYAAARQLGIDPAALPLHEAIKASSKPTAAPRTVALRPGVRAAVPVTVGSSWRALRPSASRSAGTLGEHPSHDQKGPLDHEEARIRGDSCAVGRVRPHRSALGHSKCCIGAIRGQVRILLT